MCVLNGFYTSPKIDLIFRFLPAYAHIASIAVISFSSTDTRSTSSSGTAGRCSINLATCSRHSTNDCPRMQCKARRPWTWWTGVIRRVTVMWTNNALCSRLVECDSIDGEIGGHARVYHRLTCLRLQRRTSPKPWEFADQWSANIVVTVTNHLRNLLYSGVLYILECCKYFVAHTNSLRKHVVCIVRLSMFDGREIGGTMVVHIVHGRWRSIEPGATRHYRHTTAGVRYQYYIPREKPICATKVKL